MSTKERQTDQLNAICVAMKGLWKVEKGKENTIQNLNFLNLERWNGIIPLLEQIRRCERENHNQAVAYSTGTTALTQICFSCQTVRTDLEITN